MSNYRKIETRCPIMAGIAMLCIVVVVFALLAVLIVCAGCTVTPDHVHADEISFDGNVQNSGFLQFNADGSGLITPHARDRYNGLIATYGNTFVPPLVPDAGLTQSGTNWIIDAQHLNYFKKMNRYRKEGKPTL